MEIHQVNDLARTLMDSHNLYGWGFRLDKSVRRFGACHYRSRVISLSRKLVELNPIETVKNTLLHEIAHALAPRGAGHGREWKRIAISIGCDGSRCYNSSEVATVAPKYTGECPNCNRIINRHRRMRLACGKCCKNLNQGNFSESYLFIWK